MSSLPRVVILGAGFGGLATAGALARAKARIAIIDRNNHHLFQPLLYQVATAGLSATDVASPIRSVLRKQRNVEVFMADVKSIDLAAKHVVCEHDRPVPYDKLVIATGAVTNYFGRPEWERFAPSLKGLSDALVIRDRVLLAFERAEVAAAEGGLEAAKEWLTFVVVGGGPTGVEVAGSLAELAHRTLARDFRQIDPTRARIVLLEGGPRVLATFPESLSEAARRRLERMGVTVRGASRVNAIDALGVSLQSGERIATRTVIWAAGVAPTVAPWLGGKFETDRSGRVKVESDLSLPGYRDVFVIGDAALYVPPGDAALDAPAGDATPHVPGGDAAPRAAEHRRPLPGLAPVALQQGRYVGRRLTEELAGRSPRVEPFRYLDKGNLATVGRSFAVADLGRVRLSGYFAWVTWVAVHIAYLISFHNRLLVLFEWAWAYLTWQRGARIVTGRPADPASDLQLPVPKH